MFNNINIKKFFTKKNNSIININKEKEKKSIKLSDIFKKDFNECLYYVLFFLFFFSMAIGVFFIVFLFFKYKISFIENISGIKYYMIIFFVVAATLHSLYFTRGVKFVLYFSILKYKIKGYKIIYDKDTNNLETERKQIKKILLFPLEIKNNNPIFKITNNLLYYKDENNKEKTLNIKDIEIDYTNKLENTGFYSFVKKTYLKIHLDKETERLDLDDKEAIQNKLQLPSNSLIIS